jgi:hypothetical protein
MESWNGASNLSFESQSDKVYLRNLIEYHFGPFIQHQNDSYLQILLVAPSQTSKFRDDFDLMLSSFTNQVWVLFTIHGVFRIFLQIYFSIKDADSPVIGVFSSTNGR